MIKREAETPWSNSLIEMANRISITLLSMGGSTLGEEVLFDITC